MTHRAGASLPLSQKITAGYLLPNAGGKKAKKWTAPAALFTFLPLSVIFLMSLRFPGHFPLYFLSRLLVGIFGGAYFYRLYA